MRQEDAIKYLPIIQALAEGKKIQSFRDGWREQGIWHDPKWEDVHNPLFNGNTEYRVKPEPKWRPWKPKEIPKYFLVNRKNPNASHQLRPRVAWSTANALGDSIIGMDSDAFMSRLGDQIYFTLEEALTGLNRVTDDCKEVPCGVLENPEN